MTYLGAPPPWTSGGSLLSLALSRLGVFLVGARYDALPSTMYVQYMGRQTWMPKRGSVPNIQIGSVLSGSVVNLGFHVSMDL
jgi:hypothetical protein